MSHQQSFEMRTRGRGTTQITAEVARIVRAAGVATGIAQVFVQHTSCFVMITESADPAVRRDLETLAARWAPDADQRGESIRRAPHGQPSNVGGMNLGCVRNRA